MGRFEQNPMALTQAEKAVRHGYKRFNDELAASDFVAAAGFSMADISLWVAVDFASRMVSLKPDGDRTHLKAWFDRHSKRASIAAVN